MQTLISAIIYIAANGIGLLIATVLLGSFRIDFLSFIVVVVVFSLILAILQPILKSVSEKQAPALLGGLSLITVAVGLLVTNLIMPGMEMGGLVNWIAATILVWIGSLIAAAILPRYIHKAQKG